MENQQIYAFLSNNEEDLKSLCFYCFELLINTIENTYRAIQFPNKYLNVSNQ